MLKKRLIGVITVKDDWAVQSFGYKKFLPLGKVSVIAKNLNDWGADEIFIQSIDRSKRDEGPDINLLKKLSSLSLSTPLTYAGGIRNSNDATIAITHGCERIAVDALLHEDSNNLEEISSKIGSQAIIASVPVQFIKEELSWFNYKKNVFKNDFEKLKNICNKNLVSEIFLIDKVNEGYCNAFNKSILNSFPDIKKPIILFGGISEIEQIKFFFNHKKISSVAVGNFLNYKEHSIQLIKKELKLADVRKPHFNC